MKTHEIRSLEGKAKIADEMLHTLSKIDNAVIRSGYLRRLAQILQITEQALDEELRKHLQKRPKESQKKEDALDGEDRENIRVTEDAVDECEEKAVARLAIEERADAVERVKTGAQDVTGHSAVDPRITVEQYTEWHGGTAEERQEPAAEEEKEAEEEDASGHR